MEVEFLCLQILTSFHPINNILRKYSSKKVVLMKLCLPQQSLSYLIWPLIHTCDSGSLSLPVKLV